MKNRREVRCVKAIERRSAATGVWLPWETRTFPKGTVGQTWLAQIGEARTNGFYVAMVRYLDGGPAGRIHLAIRTASNREPPWRDLQRIKNELFGPERFAVQVCPPQSRLIDEADMYHLWIMAEGYTPGFGLDPRDEASNP